MERKHLDEELNSLKQNILSMGGLVEEMIRFSVQELEERKPELIQEVLTREQVVNQFQLDVDNQCLKMLALYQPAAQDLRFVTSAMKIISELERIGDQAVNIAQTSQILIQQPPFQFRPSYINKMAKLAMTMLKECLDAFVNQNEATARKVLGQDDKEDNLKRQVFNDLLTMMKDNPAIIHQALDMILISRNLEKVADHCTNIAEDVIFTVLGKDIRHRVEGIEDKKESKEEG